MAEPFDSARFLDDKFAEIARRWWEEQSEAEKENHEAYCLAAEGWRAFLEEDWKLHPHDSLVNARERYYARGRKER